MRGHWASVALVLVNSTIACFETSAQRDLVTSRPRMCSIPGGLQIQIETNTLHVSFAVVVVKNL